MGAENFLVGLEALAAFGIAINLAYLNLPNLRYADRIKAKILEIIVKYPPDTHANVQADVLAYKSVYEAGDLAKISTFPKPTIELSTHQDGDPILQTFMLFWCTQVRFPNSTLPLDKVISAIWLTVSSLYLYKIAAIKIDLGEWILQILLVIFVVAPIVGMLVYMGRKRDKINFWIIVVAAVFAFVSMYGLDTTNILSAKNPAFAFFVLALSVGVTTLFVMFSFLTYPRAERHYTTRATNAMSGAEAKKLSRREELEADGKQHPRPNPGKTPRGSTGHS